MPPVQVISFGARIATFTGKARPAATSLCTVIFSPSAILPSTFVTPEPQVG